MRPISPCFGSWAARGITRGARLADLATRIRAGELDARLDEALERLSEHVARKLAIARPGYAD